MFSYLEERGRVSSCQASDVVDFLNEELNEILDIHDILVQRCRVKVIMPLKKRWSKAWRKRDVFLRDNEDWLDVVECLLDGKCKLPQSGRRPLSFTDKGRRAKLLATEDVRRKHSSAELVFAAASTVHQEGRRSASALVEAAGSPNRGPRMATHLASRRPDPQSYSEVEALGLMVDLDLTKSQYITLQLSAKQRDCPLYPPYKRVSKAKSACIPAVDTITIQPDQARVELQSLLDHTTARLLELQADVLTQATTPATAPGPSTSTTTNINLTLACKWGMDGSTGHSIYKQRTPMKDDEIFAVTLVPLRLQTAHGCVLWSNQTPNSPRFCRPISVKYAKETTQLTADEVQKTNSEISALRPFTAQGTTVQYSLQMTMIDGKVANAATGTASAQRCNMCGAVPSTMNDLPAVRALAVTNTEYGLSPLHCFIRCFEAILHIGYRLDLQRWRVAAPDRARLQQRKRQIQEALRDRLGLLVDEPRAGGAGTSNDGNTARRAFRASEEFAACTGVFFS